MLKAKSWTYVSMALPGNFSANVRPINKWKCGNGFAQADFTRNGEMED